MASSSRPCPSLSQGRATMRWLRGCAPRLPARWAAAWDTTRFQTLTHGAACGMGGGGGFAVKGTQLYHPGHRSVEATCMQARVQHRKRSGTLPKAGSFSVSQQLPGGHATPAQPATRPPWQQQQQQQQHESAVVPWQTALSSTSWPPSGAGNLAGRLSQGMQLGNGAEGGMACGSAQQQQLQQLSHASQGWLQQRRPAAGRAAICRLSAGRGHGHQRCGPVPWRLPAPACSLRPVSAGARQPVVGASYIKRRQRLPLGCLGPPCSSLAGDGGGVTPARPRHHQKTIQTTRHRCLPQR